MWISVGEDGGAPVVIGGEQGMSKGEAVRVDVDVDVAFEKPLVSGRTSWCGSSDMIKRFHPVRHKAQIPGAGDSQ